MVRENTGSEVGVSESFVRSGRWGVFRWDESPFVTFTSLSMLFMLGQNPVFTLTCSVGCLLFGVGGIGRARECGSGTSIHFYRSLLTALLCITK